MSETISTESPAVEETRNHMGWRTSLCTAGFRQSHSYVMRTSRQQKYQWLSQWLMVNLTHVPMFL